MRLPLNSKIMWVATVENAQAIYQVFETQEIELLIISVVEPPASGQSVLDRPADAEPTKVKSEFFLSQKEARP